MLKLAFVLTIVPLLLMAQEPSPKRLPASIQVEADSVIQVKPDRAEIDIGVVTQSPDAKTAASQNAQKLDRVIQQLRSKIGQNLEIKTIGYSVNPNYVYPPQGGEPKITGYTASNIVHVRTDELSQAASIIDVSMKAGANQVQSLQFSLKNEETVQAQALKEAAVKARKKADALASSLGVKIIGILNVIEGSQAAVPMYTRQTLSAESAKMDVSTPVEPGTVEVRAKITLTVEIQ